GADRERRRENASRNAAYRGQGGGDQFHRAEQPRHAFTVQDGLGLGVAGAEDSAIGGEAAESHQQAAGRGKQHRVSADKSAKAARHSVRKQYEEAAEQAA